VGVFTLRPAPYRVLDAAHPKPISPSRGEPLADVRTKTAAKADASGYFGFASLASFAVSTPKFNRRRDIKPREVGGNGPG